MKRLFSLLIGSMVLTATLSGTATAQEYSNGGTCQKGRGPAVVTPVEAFGVHPPGPDPADAHRFFHRWRQIFYPYYAPASPTATSARWRPWCYFPLLPYYTPYYIGYCPHRLCNPKPPPYGFDGGWGEGPMPGHAPGPLVNKYGVYTSILQDDTIFWRMGGNGLVPYGAPRPVHAGPPDLVDMIQSSRPGGPGGPNGPCQPSPDGAPLAALSEAVPAAPPAEKPTENEDARDNKKSKKVPPSENPEPPQ